MIVQMLPFCWMVFFVNGYFKNYVGSRLYVESRHLKSAYQLPEVVMHKINKEIVNGRIAGPFSIRPLENLSVIY